LNGRRLIELPAAEQPIVLEDRELVGRREREIVRAIPVGGPVLQVGQIEELVAAVLTLALQRVLREHRIPFRESLRQLRLQRIVPVRPAVAEHVDALRPSVPCEVRLAKIGRHRGEAVEPRLIAVHRGTIADEHARAVIADVCGLDRDVGRQLALHRHVVRVDRRWMLCVRQRAGEHAVRQAEQTIARYRREYRRGRPIFQVEHRREVLRRIQRLCRQYRQVLGDGVAEDRSEDAEIVAAAVARAEHRLFRELIGDAEEPACGLHVHVVPEHEQDGEPAHSIECRNVSLDQGLAVGS